MKSLTRAALAIMVASGGLLACSSPARAELELCNRTSYILYAAIAVQGKKSETTQGWTRIIPGDCKTAITEPLTRDIYYVYAHTSRAHAGAMRAWGGNVKLCTSEANFRLTYNIGTVRCDPEATALPFARINTKGKPVWATTFTESPEIDTAEAAAAAGLKRLLRDNGAKIPTLDSKSDKATTDALGIFRKRVHLSAAANTHAQFDALETEALKTAVPAGYSICNDTEDVVWAVIAFKGPKDWVSRGWWKVPAGSCARAITTQLSADRIFLHVEKHANAKLVSGPERFCLTDQMFEINGRGDCAKRKLSEAGFVATSTKGLAGYAAHIASQGLVPPLKAGGKGP
jgi:uncharacterized membrane protein